MCCQVDLEDFEVRGRDSTLQLDGRAHKVSSAFSRQPDYPSSVESPDSDVLGFVCLQGFFLLHKSARYQKVGEPGRLTREEFLDKLKPEYGARESYASVIIRELPDLFSFSALRQAF